MISSTSRYRKQQKQQQVSLTYRYFNTSIIFVIILIPFLLVPWIQQQHHVFITNNRNVIDTIVCEAFTIAAIKNQYLYHHHHHQPQQQQQEQQVQRIGRWSMSDILKLYDTTTTTTVNDNPNNNDLLNYLPSSTNTMMMMIVIEYCIGCKWNLRAFWMAQELLYRNHNNHYHNNKMIDDDDNDSLSVTLVPSSNPGTYKITHYTYISSQDQQRIVIPNVVWDRTIDGGFPEIEEIQQRILVQRTVNDTSKQSTEQTNKISNIESSVPSSRPNIISILYYCNSNNNSNDNNNVGIDTFLFRAAYVAQEIVSTFQNEIHAISLIPQSYGNTNDNDCTNIPLLTIQLNNNITIYEYNLSNDIVPFIPIKELKQRIRDYINPDMNLGHSDVNDVVDKREILSVLDSSASSLSSMNNTVSTIMNDDDDDDNDDTEAEKARQYFGVA